MDVRAPTHEDTGHTLPWGRSEWVSRVNRTNLTRDPPHKRDTFNHLRSLVPPKIKTKTKEDFSSNNLWSCHDVVRRSYISTLYSSTNSVT